jgi:hypothetical protein
MPFCSFGAVGALISYSETRENSISDTISASESAELSAGIKFEFGMLITVIGFFLDIEAGVTQTVETTSSMTQAKTSTLTRSFSLGDADDGDYFDVQVCIRCLLVSLPSTYELTSVSTDLP